MEDITIADYKCAKQMIEMIEKAIRGGICHAMHRYATANDKYMKNYDKVIESSYLMYLGAKNLCGWALSQWKMEKNTSKFNKKFKKNYYENSDKGYILEVDANKSA